MTKKSHDHYARIACAVVWADKHVGHTYRDAAKKAVQAIGSAGLAGVDEDTVLEWACLERANRFLHDNSFRAGPAKVNEHAANRLLTKLRHEVGLA